MFQLLLLCLSFFLSVATGCGPTSAPLPLNQREEPGSINQLKKDLQVIVDYGTGDSGLQPVLDGIAALDKSNPLQAELSEFLPKLKTATTHDKRKEIAKEMMEKLNTAAAK